MAGRVAGQKGRGNAGQRLGAVSDQARAVAEGREDLLCGDETLAPSFRRTGGVFLAQPERRLGVVDDKLCDHPYPALVRRQEKVSKVF